ncbi:hypothetical protein I7I48_09942 [Histoplasma ohiense]|nr:hypothetical protein I7I48_09942 [Histoplasma ohiense (nom. inval.)]
MVCRSAWLACLSLDSISYVEISMASDKNPQPRTKTYPSYVTRDREKREMKELEKKNHRNTDEGSGRIRPLKRGILFIFFSFLFLFFFLLSFLHFWTKNAFPTCRRDERESIICCWIDEPAAWSKSLNDELPPAYLDDHVTNNPRSFCSHRVPSTMKVYGFLTHTKKKRERERERERERFKDQQLNT